MNKIFKLNNTIQYRFVQRDQIRNVVDVDVARRSAEANDVEDVGLHLDAGHGQVVAHRALDAVDLDLFGGADEADLVLLVVVGRQLAEQSVRLGLGALARSKCVSDLCGWCLFCMIGEIMFIKVRN